MSGEQSTFKVMALGVAAIAMIGAFTASDGGGHYARFMFNKGKKFVKPEPTPTPTTTTTTPTPTPTTTAPIDATTTSTASNASYAELSTIASNFDINTELVPAWGTGELPSQNAPGDAGAFRFICNAGQILADDPIVFPGQPGRSHLHQFFGNLDANAYSTYSSLRSSGLSSCASPLNRSAYWMPAMLDGVGNAVRPDYIAIYYKRIPDSDPRCDPSINDHAIGKCIPLPNGLRFVFGRNMLNPNEAPTGHAYFDCDGQTAQPGHYATITEAAAHCPSATNPDGSQNRLGAVIEAPMCWDGKNFDSPDHRSHMAYIDYGYWGYAKCPDTHPFAIPTFTMGVWYQVDANIKTWRLSSDDMLPGAPAGSTFHADWFGAWDNKIESIWMANCINRNLNCAGGVLGNGQQMKAFAGMGWVASPHLVPVG